MADAAGRYPAHPDAARSFVSDARGATAIEYAMIAGMISIMIVAGASTIGQTVKTFFMEMIVPFL